jgi:hypothetical protein
VSLQLAENPEPAARAVIVLSAIKENNEKCLMENQVEQNQNDERYTEEPAKDVRHDLSSLITVLKLLLQLCG